MKITRWCQQSKATSIEFFQRKLLLYTKSFFYLLCFHVWKFFKDFPFLQNIVWIKITRQMAHASKDVENRARKAAALNCGFVIYISELANGTESPFLSVRIEKEERV